MQFATEWVRTPDDLSLALRLRERVFCGEQGVPRSLELDGRDDEAEHLLARELSDNRAVGTLRLLVVGSQAKVGRVAVDSEWRRRGIASRMLDVALERARERGCSEARLASQLTATALYRRAGFRVQSRPFEEAGIAHVWMARRLGA